MENPGIPKTYEPQKVEPYWADFWVQKGYFKPEKGSAKPSFVIVIPPPNVTGSLHMGHALNNTLQDVLIRWKKMDGFDALWVPGTDHGGIATQNVVEKLLKKEGTSRHELGREKFLERMWSWRKESGDTILMQLRRLGASLDWSRTRFTMDETCSRAVLEAFSRFYKKGWIYRGLRMVNWCVRCQTALSDIEVEFEERKDKLYHIRYPLGANDQYLIVATTRPETLLGDTAVAVHPDDPRYSPLKGKSVQLPIVNREIPIIFDSAVDPKFGTGVVKVTPAHDPADFDIGERHNLEQIAVIGFEGKMTAKALQYQMLSREECRKRILEDLEAQGLIEKIEDYPHSVGTCYRCGVIIEPLVSDQWFLKVEHMAQEAAQATRETLVQIFPSSWNGPYLHWLDNLRDWCISRQIWWGHRVPIWYCLNSKKDQGCPASELKSTHPASQTACPPVVSGTMPEKCAACGGVQWEQDPDVLDTWFSSALWPFSVLEWPQPSADLQKYYPTSVLVTGHEILYLWVARMVMFGLTFAPKGMDEPAQRIPYSHVFIHGIVRDKQGKKMSKSLGNVIDPLVMMDKFGTDALRFVLASQSVPGRDMQISDETFLSARNFANKIWNVSRFAFMNFPQGQALPTNAQSLRANQLELCDQWILSRLQKTIEAVRQSLNEYNLAQTARLLYQFLWSEFCDWYIELSKIRILDPTDSSQKRAVVATLDYVLTRLLMLVHPVMPFITEEIWRSRLALAGENRPQSLLEQPYPQLDPTLVEQDAESKMELFRFLIVAVRTIRSEMNVPPANKLNLILVVKDPAQAQLIQKHSRYLEHLCRAKQLQIVSSAQKPNKSAAVLVQDIELFIPLEGLIDFSKEKQRLEKELKHVEEDMERVSLRLSNPDFRANAPADEVERAQERMESSGLKKERLKEHLETLFA